MKSLLFTLVVLMTAQSQAWISKDQQEKPYAFRFKMLGETFDYKLASASYEEAFEKAAKACYSHFKDGKRLTEDKGLDIIDVCANPRTI